MVSASKIKKSFRQELPLHLMVLAGMVFVLIYHYGPMLGLVIAFQKFNAVSGFFKSRWVGWDNFAYVFTMPDTLQVIWNTIYIAVLKIFWGLLVPVVVALMLNEAKRSWFKRSVQTMVYLPYFLSWVILGGIIIDIFSMNGPINALLKSLGMEPVFFLGDNKWFRTVLVSTDVWKNFGFNTIVYLAAITGINPSLYEAAIIDGANRWRQTWHITLTGMKPIIILVSVLSLGGILSAGFEQIFVLYSPAVYESSDIIDTFVYRLGILGAQLGPATAVGLFKSVVSFVLVSISYFIAYKVADYRIF